MRLSLLLGFIGSLLTSSAPSTTTTEQTLTVAFLYNFLKFTEWPKTTLTSDTLTICFTDSTPFHSELAAISGRPAQNKTVQMKRVELGDNLNTCQLLFIPREEKPVRIRDWLKNVNNLPILVVGNLDDFLELGGMIVLLEDNNRLQFEVNLVPVVKAGLKLNAQLLKIAHQVKGN